METVITPPIEITDERKAAVKAELTTLQPKVNNLAASLLAYDSIRTQAHGYGGKNWIWSGKPTIKRKDEYRLDVVGGDFEHQRLQRTSMIFSASGVDPTVPAYDRDRDRIGDVSRHFNVQLCFDEEKKLYTASLMPLNVEVHTRDILDQKRSTMLGKYFGFFAELCNIDPQDLISPSSPLGIARPA